MTASTQTRLDAFLPKSNTFPRQPSKSWRDEMPQVSDTPLEKHTLRVYVLCGVVGSGKSTLAVQWEALYPDRYVRVNQDSLGDRRKCEDLTRESLRQGKSPIIDRQNFDTTQRYHWLNIGHEQGVEVVALIFRTTKRMCADRLLLRRGHETIKSPEQGLQVLNSMTAIFAEPQAGEGFHRIVTLPSGLPLHYTLADINCLLARVDEATLLPAILPEQPSPSSPRGGYWSRGGSSRGRGAPRGRGQAYSSNGQRSSPWSSNGAASSLSWRTPSVAEIVTHTSGASSAQDVRLPSTQGHSGRTPPPRPVKEVARYAASPYVPPVSTRQPATSVNRSANNGRKNPSTGFIDISSDEE